jgi:hypothetical protein
VSPAPRSIARRVLLAAFGAIGLALVAALALAARHTTPGAPRFTEADLPALPSPADNGWALLAADPRRPSAVARDVDALVLGAERGPALLDRARGIRPSLDTAVDERAEAIARLDAAIARPRFVDGCPVVPTGAPCADFAVWRWLDLGLAAALRDAVAGTRDAAVARSARVAAASVDLASSSRRAVGHVGSVSMLARALRVADAVLAAPETAGAPPVAEPARAAAAELAGRLAALRIDDLSARRAFVADYVSSVGLLAGLSAPAASPWERVTMALAYDAGRTRALLDARVDALLTALDRGAPLPDPELLCQRPLYFLDNAIGKHALDALAVPWASQAHKLDGQRAAIEEALPRVRARLESLSR